MLQPVVPQCEVDRRAADAQIHQQQLNLSWRSENRVKAAVAQCQRRHRQHRRAEGKRGDGQRIAISEDAPGNARPNSDNCAASQRQCDAQRAQCRAGRGAEGEIR